MVSVNRARVAAGYPTFLSDDPITVGVTCSLDEHAARHMRVLRLQNGAPVGLRDGVGGIGEGVLVKLSKTQATIDVLRVELAPALPEVHMLVPVADRERMLWLAEKACELGCTSWRPVLWRRSRSVSPRGEGVGFQAKVRARMQAALAQSEGAWLPQLFPDATLERALLAAPDGERLTLDFGASALLGAHTSPLTAPVVLALGPEGGLEADEIEALAHAAFRRVSLGSSILRFETAGIAALAMVRALLSPASPSTVGASVV